MELFEDDIIVDMNMGDLSKKKPNIFDDLMGEDEEVDDFFFDYEMKRDGESTNPFGNKLQDGQTRADDNYDGLTDQDRARRVHLQGFGEDSDSEDFGVNHHIDNYREAVSSLQSNRRYAKQNSEGDEDLFQRRSDSRELSDSSFELDTISQANGKEPNNKDTKPGNPEPEKSASDSNALTPDTSPDEVNQELKTTNENTLNNHLPVIQPGKSSDLPTYCDVHNTSVDTSCPPQSSAKDINWTRVWKIIECFEKQTGCTGKNQALFKSIIYSLANN